MMKSLISAVALLALANSAFAASRSADNGYDNGYDNGDTRDSHLGFVVQGNFEFGGDKIAQVFYTNGENQSVNAGQGVTLAVGGHYQFASPKLDISATLGYKYVTTKASNANIYVGRTVVEVLGSYSFTDSWWMGVGPVWHVNNSFHGDTYLQNRNFDKALGFTGKVGWKFVALSYTSINYNDQFKNKYNASNVGVDIIGRF